ncbi:MAG: hypothetical protein MZV70_03695 [Desulfobacterales bacterium]|nr:hypothetical protein [Desulfobacterales bacterium]
MVPLLLTVATAAVTGGCSAAGSRCGVILPTFRSPSVLCRRRRSRRSLRGQPVQLPHAVVLIDRCRARVHCRLLRRRGSPGS